MIADQTISSSSSIQLEGVICTRVCSGFCECIYVYSCWWKYENWIEKIFCKIEIKFVEGRMYLRQ